MEANISDEKLSQFSGFIARAIGLHFPPDRWSDLRSGIIAAAKTLGYRDLTDCVGWLMSTPLSREQLEILASHFTVGETYFFRDGKSFETLASNILPSLICQRRDRGKRLNIWSAACCTGEEPYSIAIQLCRTLPDWREWSVKLLATDVNPHFLRRAEAGIFSQWSFRDAPAWLKPKYFRTTADGQFEILPEIRQMVRFGQLNLVDDVLPLPANDTHAIDIIFCRNVLMYFTPQQAEKVLRSLYRAQADGGWLVVGASELMRMSSTAYVAARFSDATLFQKNIAESQQIVEDRQWEVPIAAAAANSSSLETETQPVFSAAGAFQKPLLSTIPAQGKETQITANECAEAAVLYEQGQYVEAVAKLNASDAPDAPARLESMARALANVGRLAEALVYCDKWLAADKLNACAHYLRGVVLQEDGKVEEALESLRTVLYLDPNYPLAHFAMANLARQNGRADEADKHLRNAHQALRGHRADESLAESDGITVGGLRAIIDTLINVEAPA